MDLIFGHFVHRIPHIGYRALLSARFLWYNEPRKRKRRRKNGRQHTQSIYIGEHRKGSKRKYPGGGVEISRFRFALSGGRSDDPNEIFTVYADGCPLRAVRVEKDRFSDIGHRDYLGAVMGLGLTRESVGDICVQPDGCDIIALPNAAKYIEDNLTGAGRATLKAKLIPLGEVRAPQVNIKETSITVASPRLDAVAGEIFSLSRSAAAQAIASGAVTVNDEQVLKADRRLSPKDKIVLRGKGRAILGEEFTQTKKGRVGIWVKKSV